jgi:hypothetical protein
MTMSDIRMQEAWAMAHWLARDKPPAFGIEKDEESVYDLVFWPDGAITRVDAGRDLPAEARRIYSGVSGKTILGFTATHDDGRTRFHEQSIAFIPFSTYELGKRPPQALCILYRPPDRENGQPQKISNLPPRGAKLLAHAIRSVDQHFILASESGEQILELAPTPPQGRILKVTEIDGRKHKLVVK